MKRQQSTVGVDGLRSFMAVLNDDDVGIFGVVKVASPAMPARKPVPGKAKTHPDRPRSAV